LEQIIEAMLGTSARIGEVLAIRKCDVDATRSPATVRICGTIVSPAGKPTHRQSHPKTAKSTRTVSVPSFTAEALRERLVAVAEEDAEHLIFFSRNHTPLTTNNVRRRLRATLDEAGTSAVTPHSFRRTVATVLDRAGGADLAAGGEPGPRPPGFPATSVFGMGATGRRVTWIRGNLLGAATQPLPVTWRLTWTSSFSSGASSSVLSSSAPPWAT